ncbi:MAG: hypothetical protein K6A05_02450 [Lachnospiraceae bacterium]|nr:hypothetical protein [Lachnospiraceae bacterium]
MQKIIKTIYGLLLSLIMISFSTINAEAISFHGPNNTTLLEEKKLTSLGQEFITTSVSKEEFLIIHPEINNIEETEIIGKDKEQIVSFCSNTGDIDTDDVALTHTIISSSNPDLKLHILEATAKESKGSKTKNGVTLSGSIHWVDRKGTNNALTGVWGSRSGSWTGTMTYEYGAGWKPLGTGSSTRSHCGESIHSGQNGFSFYFSLNSPSTDGSTVSLTIQTSAFD